MVDNPRLDPKRLSQGKGKRNARKTKGKKGKNLD